MAQFNKDNVDIVYYHGNCYDGFGSAFIIWLYTKMNKGLEAANAIEYVPCYHLKNSDSLSSEFFENISGKNVIMCDFSYKNDILQKMIESANTFIILDHHITARNDLESIPDEYKIFDMERSGVGITWDFFFDSDPMPQFLRHIQDRDIWAQQVEDTNEFVAYFYEQPFNFELWEEYLNEEQLKKAIETGRSWLEYKDRMVRNVTNRVSYIIQKINDQYAIVIYSNSSLLASDIGNKSFNKVPIGDFSCVWYYDLYKNKTCYSLRSTNNRFDVSKIAKEFGGGGHRCASGCAFTGVQECLPYERIDDHDLIPLLMNYEKHQIRFQGTDGLCALFKVDKMNDKWLESDYQDLIKRKCSDCPFIVFQSDSQLVDYNPDDNDIIKSFDYIIIYNDKSLLDPEKKLCFAAVQEASKYLIQFNSQKSFDQVFRVIDS